MMGTGRFEVFIGLAYRIEIEETQLRVDVAESKICWVRQQVILTWERMVSEFLKICSTN